MTCVNRPEMRHIFREVAKKYGLTEADLYVDDRNKEYVKARHEAWAKCYRDGRGFTYQDIAILCRWGISSVRDGISQYKARQNKERQK